MSVPAAEPASFDVLADDRSKVVGTLGFGTVGTLLEAGSQAILDGKAAVIDLSAVTGADSSGLALLIEWLSIAKHAGKALSYENIPSQLHQLADLSDVEALISPA